jgi:hypothetical protein
MESAEIRRRSLLSPRFFNRKWSAKYVAWMGADFLLPDGSEWYLVDEALLSQAANDLGGRMIDPLKTTIVQNQRSMTTWVIRKGA